MPGPDVVVDDEPLMRGPIVRGPSEGTRRAPGRSTSGGRGVVAAALLGALVPQLWFRPGRFIATGSTGPALAGIGGITRFWSTATTGTGSTWLGSSTLLQRSVTSLVRTLGAAAPLAQRAWFTVVVAVCAASVAWLALAFVRRPTAVFAAGAVAVLNPFHLTTLPRLEPMVCIAGVSLAVGVALRLRRGDHVPVFAGVLIAVWVAPLVEDPALLLIFVVVAVAALAAAVAGGSWSPVWRVAGGFVAGSLFWMVPLVVHVVTGAPGLRVVAGATDWQSWTWTQQHTGVRNAVTLVGSWAWGSRDILPATARLARFPWSVVRWALPSSVAVSLAFTWRRRVTRWLAAAVVVLVALAVGANTPFRPLNSLLHDVMPGYWLFRQPMSKFGVLLVVCFAVAVALGVDDAQRRWLARSEDPDQPQPLPVLLALLGVSAVFVHPLLLGTVVPGARPYLPSARVALPVSWADAGAALDALPGRAATLVLPLSDHTNRGTSWGYYGVDDIVARVSDRPAELLLPDGYYAPDGSSPDLMRTAETALEHGDRRAFSGAMAALGACYLAVRTDTTVAYGRDRAFADASSLLAAATHMGLRSVGSFQYVQVFAVPGADLFGVADHTVTVGAVQGTSQDRAVALASTLAEPNTVIGASATTVDAGHGLAWVPRADETGFAVAMPSGTYRAGAVPLGPSLWRASVRGLGVSLAPADRAEVNGHSLLLGSEVRLAGTRPPFALLVHAPADTAAGGALVVLEGDTVLQAAAGASVTLLAASSTAIDFAGLGVGDCGNVDGLPGDPTEGMHATSTVNGVELVSPRGSACVAVPVPPPSVVGGHRRWHLTADYSGTDIGTARACLWLVSIGRCADGSRYVAADKANRIDVVIDGFTDDLTGARLVLAADHASSDEGSATSVQFSDVHLAPVEAEGPPVTFPAAAADPVSSEVDAADAGLSLSVGNSLGQLLGRFNLPGDDCNRYDDIPSNTKVVERSGEGAPVLELSADRHSACVSAKVAVTSGIRDLTVNFSYRSSGAGVAKVALVDIGTGRTVVAERLDATSFWTAHSFRMKVPPPPEGSADQYGLYLYADGPGPGADRREVQASFRSVNVSPSTSFGMVVLPLATGTVQAAVRTLDDRFVAMHADGDAVLVFHQAFADGWRLDGLPGGATARHIEVDGWANGWVVHGLAGRSVVLQVHYRDDPLVSLAVWSLLLVLFATLVCTDWSRLRSNRVLA